MEHDARIPEPRRPIAMEDDQASDESPLSVSPLVTPGGIALSDAEKAEALAESLEAQFQPVTVPSVPAVIEMVNVELESYLQTPASEPALTNPVEVQDAIRGLKAGKAPGPNGIPNRALKHIPMWAVLSLVQIFNAILGTHHFPTAWKHARLSQYSNQGRIRGSSHPIDPLVCLTRLENYLKRSCSAGSYTK